MNSSGASKVVQFKLVLLGDSAVGKSSLVLRFVRGQFFEYQESTIGAAFLTQNVSLNDYTVKFEIWDTAGQERYHSLAPMYYRGAAAAVVVYDITNADSFGRAKSWVKELQRQGSPNIVIALAGNKCDLATKRKVEASEATEYASESIQSGLSSAIDRSIHLNTSEVGGAINDYRQTVDSFKMVELQRGLRQIWKLLKAAWNCRKPHRPLGLQLIYSTLTSKPILESQFVNVPLVI